MKKLICAALALSLAMSLAACGGSADTAAADTAGADTADAADAADADTAADAAEPAADAGDTAEPAADADAGEGESDYENIVAAGKMVIGYTVYEPMNYTDDEGNFVGFDTELATDVCSKYLSVEPEFVEINWDTKFIDLEAGNIDAVWNGMTLTDDIKANQACSDPYAMNAQVVVMKADAEYTDTSSLIGKAIAVEQGSAGADAVAADENLSQAETVGKAVQTECLMEVAAGTCDAAVLDLTLARAMTGEGTDYADLVIVDELNEEEYGVAFRKGSDLPQYVNDAFQAMVASGRMNELSERYGVALTPEMMGE